MSASRLSRALGRPLVGLIALYRVAISPWLGPRCRFQPTCSEYARQAIERFGAFRGGWLALKRIGRCHPWGGAGYDPLPGDEPPQRAGE